MKYNMYKGKLRIALVVAETAPIPDVLGGGAERLVTMLINQNEIDKRVVFYVVSKFDKEAQSESLRYRQTNFIYIKNKNIINKIYNAVISFINYLFRCQLKKRGYYDVAAKKLRDKCDIFVDQNGYVKEIAFISKKYGKTRVISHIHWKVDPKERKIDNFYGGIIGVSEYIANYWMKHTTNDDIKKMVVYSAVDEKRFNKEVPYEKINKIKKDFCILENTVVFIYCGRIHEQKGVKELIKAFMSLNNENVKLLIIGGSHLQNSIESEYEKEVRLLAKSDKRICFTGYVNNEDIYMYYKIANVQVIPTIVEEAAGLVAIEGMLCGLPIIASNSGGLPEYINPQCSIIVEKDCEFVNNLKVAMNELLINDSRRKEMSESAVIHSKMYSQKKFYNDFIDNLEDYYFNLRGKS